MSGSTSKARGPNNLKATASSLCEYLARAIKMNRAAATGEDGFEGLVAILLSALTDQSFHVAGSGLQQTGDAIDDSGRISLQCKAYFGNNQPQSVSILGDLEAQLHSNEDLDILVVAMRKLTAQNITTLQERVRSHGLDLICLQCTERNPELLLLLCSYWNRVSDHPLIMNMPIVLQDAIQIASSEDASKGTEALDRLKMRIQHCDGTYTSNCVSSMAYLRRRFGVDVQSNMRSSLYPIELSSAITRNDSAAGFRKWWQGDAPILIATGEEGCGKSWLLAQEAWRILESGDAMVLWLDSIHWQSATSIKDAVETAFHICLGIPDSEMDVCQRLYRKLELRWQRPTLLILDGMNERSCRVAADRIYGSLCGQGVDCMSNSNEAETEGITEWRLPKALRIVISTRPLNLMPGNVISAAQGHVRTFSVPPYSDSEFKQILSRNNLAHDNLPNDAHGLLRYPRFFSVFLRVRSRIPSAAIITPSVIWWYDLLAKIESGLDPAITSGLNLTNTNDAETLLVKIAEKLNPEGELSLDHLNSLFGGQYLNIRSELLNSRLFKDSGRVSATPSDDHVALAWGLIILRLLQNADSIWVWTLADRIHEFLEPGLSDSRRALGILVALQLSLTGEGELSDEALAAGILAWFCSHNIFGRQDQLEFWCKHRLNAYRLFIEDLLISPRAGSPEMAAVIPLARLWRDDPTRQDEMTAILRRWLLATWSEGQPEGQSEKSWQGIQLPVLPHEVQLRLTPIAMSILSQRPLNVMLSSLAECHASAHQSTGVHGGKRFPTKWPHKMLEPLMRWNYTEQAVTALNTLIDQETRPDVKESYQWLIGDGLGLGRAREGQHLGPISIEAAIRKNHDPRASGRTDPRSWIYGMEFLAVRDDLPEINIEVKAEILHLFETCCDPKNDSIDPWYFNGLWPWTLKLDSQVFENACIGPLEKTLTGDKEPNCEILHHFQGFMWKYSVKTISHAIDTCVQKHRESLTAFTAEILLEWLLLHASDDQITEYLIATENLRAKRGYLFVNLMSITELLRMLKPGCVVKLARKQAETISSIPQWQTDSAAVERMEYWLTLWANAEDKNDSDVKWAIRTLAQDCPPACRNDCVRLLARSAGPLLPPLIRTRPDLAACLEDEDFVYMLRHGYLPKDTSRALMLLWAERDPKMLAHSGRLFLLRDDYKAFEAWGHELLQLANQCALDSDCFSPTGTRFKLDSNGRITSRGPVDSRGKSTLINLGPNSWGRDEGVQPGYTADPSEEFEKWQASEETLKKWTGFGLRDFGDEYSLRSWAERHPTEFRNYCVIFFTRVLQSPETTARFGVFPHYLLAVMLQLYPSDAYAYWERLRSVSINYIYTVCEAELLPSIAWRPSVNQADGITEVRRTTLLQAENDEAIMGLALNATHVGTAKELLSVCRQLLESSLSKERALAVSALGWTWESPTEQLLRDLSLNDPSCWVRDFAHWTLGVRRQDSACRRAYRRALEATDIYAVSRELHIMKPALLPSCIVWRELEEAEAAFPESDPSPQKEALIRHFWYHWDCVSNHHRNTEVRGRRMKEYLRGHKVDRLAEEQMAPWWSP